MTDKTHLLLFVLQIGLIVHIVWQGWRDYKSDMKMLDRTRKIYEQAMKDKQKYDTMKTFADTTFCTCESCTNRECPRKLTRLVLFDASMMEVPVRVKNFYGSCHDYTEEEEDAVL